MTIDRIFLAFMTLCGIIIALVFVIAPQSRDSGIPAYFWVLIPMAIFEGMAFFRGRSLGAPGPVITVWTRLIGFVIAIALILAIPYLSGQPVVQLI
jgi:hypothetical protein